jgi:hypothetical protein
LWLSRGEQQSRSAVCRLHVDSLSTAGRTARAGLFIQASRNAPVIHPFSQTYQASYAIMGRINQDEERRNARRFQVSWDVNVRGTDQTGSGFDEAGTLENLSSLGALLYLPRLVNLGERLELQINVPFRGNLMKYAAQVVRLDQESTEAGVALKFDTSVPVFLLAH